MATYTNGVLVNTSTKTQVQQSTDTIALNLLTVVPGGTLTLTGATVVGLSGSTSITDGTGTLGFLGAAGALSATGLTTITLSGGLNAAVAYSSTGSVFSGTGGWSTSGITTVDLDCSGALQINSSGGAISIGNDAVNQNMSIGTSGTRTISVGSATATLSLNSTGGAWTNTIKGSQAGSWVVTDGGSTYISISTNAKTTTLGEVILTTGGTASAPNCVAVTETSAESLALGALCYRAATTGKVGQANAGTSGKQLPIGTCVIAAGGADASTAVAHVGKIPIIMDSAPAAGSIGSYVYMSSTSGKGTLTKPTAAGTTAFIIGVLASGNGSDTTVLMTGMFQYIADN